MTYHTSIKIKIKYILWILSDFVSSIGFFIETFGSKIIVLFTFLDKCDVMYHCTRCDTATIIYTLLVLVFSHFVVCWIFHQNQWRLNGFQCGKQTCSFSFYYMVPMNQSGVSTSQHNLLNYDTFLERYHDMQFYCRIFDVQYFFVGRASYCIKKVYYQ